MQVGTYPTRNFAHFVAAPRSLAARAGHFCRPLHVAMQVGLYLRRPAFLRGSSGMQSLRIPRRSKPPRPFLLIVCTRGIFTAARAASSPRYSDFPANSRILLRREIHLRTVIVTAAVYRGFGSELSLLSLTFRHRAGVTPYTSSRDLAECCVFVKQSPPPIMCRPSPLARVGPSLSRSYGGNLPSSFNAVLSSALVYSTSPPVSV